MERLNRHTVYCPDDARLELAAIDRDEGRQPALYARVSPPTTIVAPARLACGLVVMVVTTKRAPCPWGNGTDTDPSDCECHL